MYDKSKKRNQGPKASDRARRQIAVEAARRLLHVIAPKDGDPEGRLRDATAAELYTAKRRAAAVLGHRVRPGDLPADSEVRQEVLALARSKSRGPSAAQPEPDSDAEVALLADHVDRYAIYKMRLVPLETIKQNPKHHPEGDVLYHSLQVFEHARAVRPYDEEFLLAALLHDVGKSFDPNNPAAAAADALRGAVTDRTIWLIEHHVDQPGPRDRGAGKAARKNSNEADSLEDLALLRDLDEAGRVPGAPVPTVDQALAYLKGLEDEAYLQD
jgi:hypothetical protein